MGKCPEISIWPGALQKIICCCVSTRRSPRRFERSPFLCLTKSCIDTTDAIRRETEGLKPEKDKDLQREVHNDPQRLELVAGNTIDGFTRMHTEVSRTQARAHANKNSTHA